MQPVPERKRQSDVRRMVCEHNVRVPDPVQSVALLLPILASGLVLVGVSCRTQTGSKPGETYRRIARPEIWQVLPHGQAEVIGLRPGDILLVYDSTPVQTNEDVRQVQAAARTEKVTIVVLRGDEELTFTVKPGPLGVMPVSARYPSSLAVALWELMRSTGRFADYDWLAALSGEAFTFTARPDECRAWWPGGKSGVYLEALGQAAGLSFSRIPDPAQLRATVAQGRPVLVRGGWPEHRSGFWGVVTRLDPRDSVLYGYSLDSATELALTGPVKEAYTVISTGQWAEPVEVLRTALTHALELAQVYADTGWRSGIEAYDLVIASLDTVPFCPRCGIDESQACFDRLVWATLANRESADRFLEGMKLALPDQVALIDEALAVNRAIISKLNGMLRSGSELGRLEEQRKLGHVFSRIELDEVQLISIYEDILSSLPQ